MTIDEQGISNDEVKAEFTSTFDIRCSIFFGSIGASFFTLRDKIDLPQTKIFIKRGEGSKKLEMTASRRRRGEGALELVGLRSLFIKSTFNQRRILRSLIPEI